MLRARMRELIMTKSISIKRMMIAFMFIYMDMTLLGFAMNGHSELYNVRTLLYNFEIVSILSICLLVSDDSSFLIVCSASIYFIVMIFPKMMAYAWIPHEIHYQHQIMVMSRDPDAVIFRGIAYILYGLISFMIGVYFVKLLSTVFIKNSNDHMGFNDVRTYNEMNLLYVFLITSAIYVYCTIYLGDSSISNVYYGVSHKFVGVLTHLFSPVDVMIVAVVSLLSAPVKLKRLIIMALIISLYALTSILSGSRSFAYTTVVILAAIVVSLRGNIGIKINLLMAFVGIAAFLSLFGWYFGNYIRGNALDHKFHQVKIADNHGHHIYDDIRSSEKRLRTGFDSIVARLCDLDYASLTVSLNRKSPIIDKYMNIEYGIKSSVNIIVPGAVFRNANINTSFLWPFIYKDRNMSLLKQAGYYQTIPWTSWGLAFVMFGWWGGLLFMFLAGVVFNGANLLIRSKVKKYRPYLLALCFLFAFRFFGAMGMDDYIVVVFGKIVYVAVAFILLELLSRLRAPEPEAMPARP